MNWSDHYLRHFMHFFYKPFDIETYNKDDVSALRLATFDHGFKNYRIYASLGLSDHAELPDIGEVVTAAAVLMEISDEWVSGKAYLTF